MNKKELAISLHDKRYNCCQADTYKLSSEILTSFEAKNGSTICGELNNTGKVLRSYPDCIMDAVEIAERVLQL